MVTRTVKIPLTLTQEQTILLQDTLKLANTTFNHLSGLAVQNRIISKQKLHGSYYELLRETYPALPSAYQQSLRDQLVEGLKSIHANHPKKKWIITPSRKQYSAIRLDARTFTIRGEQLTVSTVGSRVRTIISIPEWFRVKYPNSTLTRSATLSFDKRSNRFFLNLIFDVTIPTPLLGSEVVGVDRGVYNLMSTSTNQHYSSSMVRGKRREYLYLRKKLQQKGTRSAKRLLAKRSGKEKRFMLNNNHTMVNQLLYNNPNTKTIVLEKLTGIRKQHRGKKMNTFLSQWSYHQLETILTYKSAAQGINIEYVDPRYTSQTCNQCKTINKNNRHKNKYSCSCGWTTHADYNAALNIRDLYVKSSLPLQVGQGAVNHPHKPAPQPGLNPTPLRVRQFTSKDSCS